MSIINNVLKDLESRPHQFTPIEVAVVNHVKDPGSKKYSMVIGGASTLALIVTVLFYYETNYRAESQPSTEKPAITQINRTETVVEDATSIDIVNSNRVTALQIQESASDISLEFSIQKKAVSYLKERSETRFVYHLKNVESEIEAPRISNNRWIESLDIETGKQGVDIVLTTVPGVLVNTSQVENMKEVLWTIQMEKRPDPAIVATLEIADVQPEKPGVTIETRMQQSAAINANTTEKPQQIEKGEPVKLEIKTTSPSLNHSAQLNRALESIRAGRWTEAEKLLLDLLGSPLDFSARKHLLGVYASSGNNAQYLDLAKQSQKQYPQQTLFKTEYARALFHNQQYLEVISYLQDIGAADSTRHALMAASYQRKNQHQKAVEHYHHALKLDKTLSRSWVGLGISLEHESKLEKALQSYQTALRLGNLNDKLTEFVEQRSKMLKRVMN